MKSQLPKEEITSLGLFPFIFYQWQRLRSRYTRLDKPFRLYSRYAKFPLLCRPNTSDLDVFGQLFVNREYRCLDDVREAGLIIDCGAYVGFSSAYFLTRFPRASIIAIEPDQENFSLLETNLAPYKTGYRTLRSAVWSKPVELVPSEEPFGDGREWTRRVREARPGEKPTVTGVEIGTLLRDSGYDRISILKVDIEGAETVIFSSNYESWLGKVDNLVIELHGDGCRDIFRKAISTVDFSVSQLAELTICKRRPN